MKTIRPHLISHNIRAFYRRRLVAPILYLIVLTVLWLTFPLGDIFTPTRYPSQLPIDEAYAIDLNYVQITLEDLTFTGYTTEHFAGTNGYFYYGQNDSGIFIVLLAPDTCEEGLPTIDEVTILCRIMKGQTAYAGLLDYLATDLDWTQTGIANQLPKAYFSEPDYNPIITTILYILYFGSGLYSLICIALYILYLLIPSLAPACQNLIVFGNPFKLLEEAEEELATLPQLATEDMFITEHYFILTSPNGNAIVPIQEILWIYKHSTLHKFLWYHFSISDTLHICGTRHFYLQCPKNTQSDIDGIIDYLAEANHNILVGFTEKNRSCVENIQGKPFHIEKLYALLRKKI